MPSPAVMDTPVLLSGKKNQVAADKVQIRLIQKEIGLGDCLQKKKRQRDVRTGSDWGGRNAALVFNHHWTRAEYTGR